MVELEQKAERYAIESGYVKGRPDFWITVQAYIAGHKQAVKENAIKWHDLRKNPNDLPTQDNTSMSDYVITDRGFGYYNGRIKSWWVKNDCALTDKVIAWCEIPKFEVEE